MDFLLGGMASVTAEIATFPVDMAKTRLQLQGQIIDKQLSGLKYRGMIHTIRTVAKEEGVCALYGGLSAAILRQATYGTIKIGIYQNLKYLMNEKYKIENSLAVNTLNGVLAGGIATLICSPTDMFKIRFQAQQSASGLKQKKSLFGAINSAIKEEGFFGLYRGVLPNTYRAAVVTGVELAFYDKIKQMIISANILTDSPACHLMSSGIAGLMGAFSSNPFDVIKSRMMNQRNIKQHGSAEASPAIYRNSFHCVTTLVKTEGFLALYKGIIPSICRLVPWNIVFFMSLEQYKGLAHDLNIYDKK